MKRVEVKLSLEVVAPILDIIKSVADDLKSHLAVETPPAVGDTDMAEVWRDDLLTAQNAGVDAFLALFDSDFFEAGVIRLDAENAEQILRACAALRLQIRSQQLGTINDETLESGIKYLDTQSAGSRRAVMCYIFLATLQELIIEHLDSAILGEDGI